MDGSPETTNLLLGIMATVSVVQMLVLVVAAVVVYRQVVKVRSLLQEYERRHVEPLSAKANEILNAVQGVTERVGQESERADASLRNALNLVDETTNKVRVNVRSTLSVAAAVVEAARAVVEAFAGGGRRSRPRPKAADDAP